MEWPVARLRASSHCANRSVDSAALDLGMPISLAITLKMSSGSAMGAEVDRPDTIGVMVEDGAIHFLKIVPATAKDRLLDGKVCSESYRVI
jgi:hypothetical protein